jgi:hypothetical protein
MSTEFRTRLFRHPRGCLPLVLAGVLLLVVGCQPPNVGMQLDNPELSAFVRLLMPAKIEIQRYLTKPFDFEGSGDADGLEVILTTLDSFGDPVKCTGTFHFDLHTMRLASGDKLGKQVAHWPVTINSDRSLVEYWDRYARCYRFPLKLRSGKLAPGQYILSACLITPTTEKLYDTYEFTYGEP